MHFKRGTVDHGCDNQFRVNRKTSWCRELLLDSGAQFHACPIPYPGQKIPLPDPGFHTASGARLQHDGGRLVTYKLPKGRTTRVLFNACAVQKPILSLGCLAQQGFWSDHWYTVLSRRNTAKHSLFFVKGMMVAPLSTTGVSDEVAQELPSADLALPTKS